MLPVKSPFDLDLHASLPEKRLEGLWRLMRGFRLRYLTAILCLGIAALAKTSTYLVLRYFTDQILVPSTSGQASPISFQPLVIVAAGFIALALTEGCFTFFSGRLAAYASEGVAQRLRNFMFDHIQHLTFSYHDRTQTGEIIQRSTSDVDALRRFYAEQAIGLGRIVLLFTINFIAILNMNVMLAFFSIIAIPFVVLISFFFFRRVSKAYESYQEQDAVVSTTLQENLTGVRVVKAFARQRFEKEKFDKENWEKFIRGRHLLTMHSTFWPLSDILCGVQMLAGFVLAAWMAINGSISIGDYVAYAGLLVWLIFPMRNLGRLIVQTSTGMVSYGRVMEIIRQEREPLTDGLHISEGSMRGELVFENVDFAYDADKPILSGISFHCQPGGVVALLGSTGSGKTSLVNLLPRFYEYTGGRILLDNTELNRLSRQFLRSQIGIVEQEPFLFSRSIRENIAYGLGLSVSDEEIQTAARAAAIHDVILSFPNGYNTLIGEKGVTLSGGQKQRVAIARALLKNPRILILDDATSSVDTETEAVIREALEHLMKDRTSFVIAHRIQSLVNADLILVMDKGRIIQQGRHSELVQADGMYQQIYRIQTRIETELQEELATAQVQNSHV
jgi:ATP-binding cassette subfamily B protein